MRTTRSYQVLEIDDSGNPIRIVAEFDEDGASHRIIANGHRAWESVAHTQATKRAVDEAKRTGERYVIATKTTTFSDVIQIKRPSLLATGSDR